MRVCRVCGVTLTPLVNICKANWEKSHDNICRSCKNDQINKWKRERRRSDEEFRLNYNEKKKEYYHTHKQDISAANKKLRLKNPDRYRVYRVTATANKLSKKINAYIAYRKSREVYHLFQFLEGVTA